jgi:phosphatidylethanolamine/phosphatidyl-N-methylethanolamine N-methyltransferase
MDWTLGKRVLEIGIGTGLCIPLYPAEVELTGIDVCEPMLEKARHRAGRRGFNRVDLSVMDAEKMKFAQNAFDHTVAMYIASVTPDPVAMVREMRRVTRPGGCLYILNHFSRQNTAAFALEKLISPLASVIGFEPLFPLDEFQSRTGLQDAEDIPIRPFGYWRLLRVQNKK